MSNIVFAKPGDAMWKLVSPGQASHWLFDYLGKVAFQSLVSIGGRCYFSSPEGSVYVLRLQPLPRLVEIVNQRSNKMSRDDTVRRYRYIHSFLIGEGSMGRLLMVRYHRNIDYLGGMAAYNQMVLFTGANGITGCIELIQVDIAGKRLVPLSSLGGRAVFVGETHCVAVSTKTFPSIAPDAIYTRNSTH
nr:unnamed protein product [Digitaria exilis]